MNKALLFLLVPLLSSCISFDSDDAELMERVKIENVIESRYVESKWSNVDIKYKDMGVFKDYKLEILDFLAAINYEEVEKDIYYPSYYVLNYGGGEEDAGIHLHESLELIKTSFFADLIPEKNRYYKISKSDGEKLLELAQKVYDGYSLLVDPNSSKGTIEDYFELIKPSYMPIFDIKVDYFKTEFTTKKDRDLTILGKMNKAQYTPIDNSNIEANPILIYDIKYDEVRRNGFGWDYTLYDDYQTIKLDYTFYNASKKEHTKVFYYQISEENGLKIVNEAKSRGSGIY